MNNQPKISVAIATYNGEKYLRKQLDSIYNQTIKPKEIIVCDDCSTDGTIKILEEYKNKFQLKFYINSTRLGYIKNFEKAIGLCNEEFIALSDQDDIWINKKLEILTSEIKDNLLIFSNALLINSEDEIIEKQLIVNKKIYIDKPSSIINYIFNPKVTGCTVLIRKSLFHLSYPFPENIPHDFWLALTAIIHGKIKFKNDCLILYRQHSNNSIGISHKSNFINLRKSLKKESKAKRFEYMKIELAFLESVKRNIIKTPFEERILDSKIKFTKSQLNNIFKVEYLLGRLKFNKYYGKSKISSLKEIILYIKDTLFL